MENTNTQPQKGRRIVKIAIVLAILLAIAGAGGYLMYKNIDLPKNHPALKVSVSTAINETSGYPTVTNVTMEQTEVPSFYRRADAIPEFPEITIETKANAIKSEPIAYRAGVFRPTEGNYTLTVTFYDGKEPKVNDTLILAIRLSDFRGAIVKKTTAFYEWK